MGNYFNFVNTYKLDPPGPTAEPLAMGQIVSVRNGTEENYKTFDNFVMIFIKQMIIFYFHKSLFENIDRLLRQFSSSPLSLPLLSRPTPEKSNLPSRRL